MNDADILKIFNDRWPDARYDLIPAYMLPGLLRYIVCGIRPGSFMCAVLEGDLFAAVRKADDTNVNMLAGYTRFLMNWAPARCFGSADTVNAWVKAGGMAAVKMDTNDA